MGAVKVTLPLKVVPVSRYKPAVPVRVKAWAVEPVWVKPLNLSVPAEKPLPPTVMALVSAKVEVPPLLPKITPVPEVLLTTMFPLKAVPEPA